MQIGRRIAFDIGKARIGVAASDFHAILASPQQHIKRVTDEQAVVEMVKAIAEFEPIAVYVGLPVNLRNEVTESTRDSIRLAKLLSAFTPVPVYLIDERLTTSVASKAMTNAGKNQKEQRSSIDSAAATVILEQAIQAERMHGEVQASLAKDYPNA